VNGNGSHGEVRLYLPPTLSIDKLIEPGGGSRIPTIKILSSTHISTAISKGKLGNPMLLIPKYGLGALSNTMSRAALSLA